LSVLTFFRYSFQGVLRNKRRSLFAALGIALAMALVSGSLIAVDSSAYGLLRSAVDKVDVDFSALQYPIVNSTVNTDTFNASVDAIESVKSVQEANPFVTVHGWTLPDPQQPSYSDYGDCYLAFLPSDSDRFLKAEGISGTMPDDGTVAIPKDVADSLDIGISDTITLSMVKTQHYYSPMVYAYNNSYLNRTFIVSQIWTQDYSGNGGSIPYHSQSYDSTSTSGPRVYLPNEWGTPIVLNMASFDSVMTPETRDFMMGYASISVSYLIWIDRDKVIDLANIDATVKGIEFIQHRLERQGQVSGFYVSASPLVSALQNMQPQLESQKVLFMALSLPVVALGTYLSIVGVDLGVTSRRREIGILKSRGASNRHVFFSLILESVMLGAFAALIGLLMGVVVSRFLLGSALSLSSEAAGGSSSWTDFKLSGGAIELTILFGIGLMLLSSWRPFKRASKMDVAEAIHYYSHAATKMEYKPVADIILLSLSILSIVSILVGFNWVNNTSWSWMTKMVVAIVMLIGTILFPVMPFMLSLSVIRLMTRGPRKLYSKLSWFVKGWTKELHQLVDKNIIRNPRRASNIAVIISLSIAFGLFISVTMESSIGLAREQVKYDVGADISVTSYTQGTATNISRLDQLQTISGVSHVAMYNSLTLEAAVGQYGFMSIPTVVLNSSAYQETVRPSDFYFVHSGNGMLDDLAENGSIILTTSFAQGASILVGDPLWVTLNAGYADSEGNYQTVSYEFVLNVIGVIKGLPGLGWTSACIDIGTLKWIPERDLRTSFETPGAFIDVSKDYDAKTVASAAETIFTSANLTPVATTMEEQLAALEDDLAFGSLSDYLYMEYAMSIIIMSVGVGLIIFVAVADREQELACIMARGSSGSQMRRILMGESITLMILGLSVGAIVGLISAYLFNTLTMAGSPWVVPHRMLFTYVTGAMVLVASGSLVVAALLATARAGRIRLAEVLRIRGG
jgi:ABC-type lipoprotein release transport system permease subunit